MKNILVLAALFLTLPLTSFAEDKKVEDKVLATVNGVSITRQEVTHFISKLSQPVSEERALQEMVNVELVTQEAKNQNVMKDNTLLLEIKRTTTGLIASHYLSQYIDQLSFSDQQLQERYQKDYAQGVEGKEYNADHILVKTEAEAEDIIQQLNKGGKFAELAQKLSVGPSGKNGGKLGWFKSTDMVGPFSQATMQLNAGEFSKKPVQTQFGWHVISLNETRELTPPSFDEVRQKIMSTLATESLSAKIQSLHEKANIQINSPE